MKLVRAGWLGADSGCCSCSGWWPGRVWEAQVTCCCQRWSLQEGAWAQGGEGIAAEKQGAGVIRTSVPSSK